MARPFDPTQAQNRQCSRIVFSLYYPHDGHGLKNCGRSHCHTPTMPSIFLLHASTPLLPLKPSSSHSHSNISSIPILISRVLFCSFRLSRALSQAALSSADMSTVPGPFARRTYHAVSSSATFCGSSVSFAFVSSLRSFIWDTGSGHRF